MNFSNRGFISIKRNLGKTILLLLLVFALSSITSATISINQATEVMEQNLKSGMLPVAMIEFDWVRWDEVYMETGKQSEITLSPELIREIGGLPYVKNFDYSAIATLYNPELGHYEPDCSEGTTLVRPEGAVESFTVKGTRVPSILDIEGGIVEARVM